MFPQDAYAAVSRDTVVAWLASHDPRSARASTSTYTLEATLVRVSRGMHLALGRYARHFNDRHGRTGHLFGGRFGARLIADDEYLALAVDYVLHNPVRAGIVDAPQDWPWCGARRRGHAPPRLLENPAVDAATLAFRAS